MNWGETPHLGGGSGGSGDGDRQPGRRVIQLQGPRPSPLSVNKESRKIGKPPLPAPPYNPPRAPPPRNREPVIIYDVSPKVIHTEASDFMSVVQRLTGLCSSPAASTSAGGPISPAARIAAIERASPTGRGRERASESEFRGIAGWDTGEFDLGQIPGILSPAPANLPTVTTGMFPQVMDPQTRFGFQDNLMSPLYGNYFLPSPNPNALFSGTTLFSPSHSPVFDISTLFHS